MRKLLLYFAALLLLAIAVPPLWFRLFPPQTPTLPEPGTLIELAPGVRANVLDEGGGPTAVLVHGLPGSAYDWRHLSSALTQRGLRVIAYDRLGYGHSDVRPGESHTVRDNARDLLELLAALDLRDATVVGWSYGGVTAMRAAMDDDDRIARLVLVGTGGPSSDDDVPPTPPLAMRVLYSTPVLRWRSAVPPMTRSLQAALSDVAFSGGPQPEWWLPSLNANFARWETTMTYKNEMFAPIDDDGFDLDGVRVPVLLIHATDDRLAPVDIARYLASKLPNAQYDELAGASHMLPITHPDHVADQVVSFREQTASAGASAR